jgi:magnesium transporter
VRIIDLTETYREICSDLMDLYLSSVSNRMNEVMKVLTVISTLFIPLTFNAGLYGMNFQPESSPWNMPELTWYFGYPLCILAMVVISGLQLWFFYRRGWIGPGRWGEQSLIPTTHSEGHGGSGDSGR